MSMIKCEEVCLFEEAFKRNLNDVEKKDNIPVKLETNFAPNTSKEVQDAKLELLMIIGEENAERYAFYYKIKVTGIFSWYEERMSIEEAQKEIELKGMEILYSFIRTYFYDTLKKAGMDPIVLPPVRLN